MLRWLKEQSDLSERRETWRLTMEIAITLFWSRFDPVRDQFYPRLFEVDLPRRSHSDKDQDHKRQ
jgi:hypothetical protein